MTPQRSLGFAVLPNEIASKLTTAAAAIFLILELGHLFTGLMMISDEPREMRSRPSAVSPRLLWPK